MSNDSATRRASDSEPPRVSIRKACCSAGSGMLEAWRPPPVASVTSFRRNRASRLVFITGTAGATSANWFVGAGFDARLDRAPERLRHADGIAGLRDGGVEQDGVVAELHRLGRV